VHSSADRRHEEEADLVTSLSADIDQTLETDELGLEGRERKVEVDLPSVIYSQG
jgi:hypothetical protein